MSFEGEKEFGRTSGILAYFELFELNPELMDQQNIQYVARRAADLAINQKPRADVRGLVPEFVARSIVAEINRLTLLSPEIEGQSK